MHLKFYVFKSVHFSFLILLPLHLSPNASKSCYKKQLVHVIPLLEKCYRFLLYTTQISNHGVLIILSHHNKMATQIVWLKQLKFISSQFSRLENPRSRPSRVRFLVRASFLACSIRLHTRGRERERK